MTQLTENQTSENKLYWVSENIIADTFPPVSSALSDPDGLLAIGGDLSPARLISAYKSGIFPWYSKGQPVLWWSPDPRCILLPGDMHISKSLGKTLKSGRYQVTFNKAFNSVIRHCAAPRNGNPETWITDEIINAYTELNRMRHILSVETWFEDEIVGGLYGLRIGDVFFGESMFSHMRDASKVALATVSDYLKSDGCQLIDCQIHSKHLQRLGAKLVKRKHFINKLKIYCDVPKGVNNDF
jgi:leucyl/phenylalanyl-tRNA--protein transferase